MPRLRIEATKFTVVGAANFVLTLVVFTGMLKLLHVNYLISLLTAWFIGMLFSYVLNFSWVFKPERQLEFKSRFIRFLVAGVISIGLNMLALGSLVEHTGGDPFYLQFALVPLIVCFNFLTAKYWALRRSRDATLPDLSP